jgi:hypothetical protein
MPTAEEREQLNAIDRRLDAICRKLNAPPEGTEWEAGIGIRRALRCAGRRCGSAARSLEQSRLELGLRLLYAIEFHKRELARLSPSSIS